jgi:thiol:disulfide interchange protein
MTRSPLLAPLDRSRFSRISVVLLLMLVPLLSAPSAWAAANLALPDSAVGSSGRSGGEDKIEARLVVDSGAAVARVGVLFDIAPGWHLYWRNPGEVGLPTELSWSTTGGEVGPIAWPAPERFDDEETELSSYGYERQVLLSSPISKLSPGQRISVEADVLICARECIPARFDLERTIAEAPNPAARNRQHALFERYAAKVPVHPESIGARIEVQYSRTVLRPGDEFDVALIIESCVASEANCSAAVPKDAKAYYPDLLVDEALDIEFTGLASDTRRPNVRLITFHGVVDPDVEPALSRLSGVVALRIPGHGDQFVSIDLPFPSADAGAVSSELGAFWMQSAVPLLVAEEPIAPTPSTGLVQIILLALLGGLLLNGMPCVLPVLGIKVCSAAELAQRDPSELRRHGLAYLGGVTASMAVLAGVVALLQAAGTSVGWGFQFQEPLFVAAVATVVVLFALNLFGVYEIQISTSELSGIGATAHGPARSFFDGLLAVVLATPCTAPFLGTAVGFAFAGGAFSIFAIFLAIGVGLAAPYCAICLVPGWARFVPKPGNWMLRLRAGLGFLLMATAVWLIWIFGRSGGMEAVVSLLALLVAVSFGAWLFGWVQTSHSNSATYATLAALLALSVFGLRATVSPPDAARKAQGVYVEDSSFWLDFEMSDITASLVANRPVFVSFTADWCITCKVNEHGVLADARVRAALEAGDFVAFRGDWTQRDEAIRAELARHGRAGVPLYLVYDPRHPGSPRILPEILTVAGVLEALKAAEPSDGREPKSASRDRAAEGLIKAIPTPEAVAANENAPATSGRGHSLFMEHETRFELATLTLAT